MLHQILLLAALNKADLKVSPDRWRSMVCRSNLEMPVRLLQMRASRGRWSLLKTRWWWRMRRRFSTVSSPRNLLRRWSGSMKTTRCPTNPGKAIPIMHLNSTSLFWPAFHPPLAIWRVGTVERFPTNQRLLCICHKYRFLFTTWTQPFSAAQREVCWSHADTWH